jgi:tRNA (adenine37-N6)-methyltransferase
MKVLDSFTLRPLGHIETPFAEKFGVPRQSLLIPEAWGRLPLPRNDFFKEALRGMENSSHLWLIFGFHEISDGTYNSLVRPPRFQNKIKMGVYATRSPHRPNRLGLTLVEFDRLVEHGTEIELWVRGVDLVTQTPIFDIKPYLPYAEAIADAKTPFVDKPHFYNVVWKCEKNEDYLLVEKVVGLDPRPAYLKDSSEEFGVTINGFNVKFQFLVDHFEIISLIRLK